MKIYVIRLNRNNNCRNPHFTILLHYHRESNNITITCTRWVHHISNSDNHRPALLIWLLQVDPCIIPCVTFPSPTFHQKAHWTNLPNSFSPLFNKDQRVDVQSSFQLHFCNIHISPILSLCITSFQDVFEAVSFFLTP